MATKAMPSTGYANFSLHWDWEWVLIIVVCGQQPERESVAVSIVGWEVSATSAVHPDFEWLGFNLTLLSPAD